jgi:hypothetical protein
MRVGELLPESHREQVRQQSSTLKEDEVQTEAPIRLEPWPRRGIRLGKPRQPEEPAPRTIELSRRLPCGLTSHPAFVGYSQFIDNHHSGAFS